MERVNGFDDSFLPMLKPQGYIQEEGARCKSDSVKKQEGKGLKEELDSLKSEQGRRARRRNGRFSEHLLYASEARDGRDMWKRSVVKARMLEVRPFGSKRVSSLDESCGLSKKLSVPGLWSCPGASLRTRTSVVAARANAWFEFHYFHICFFF